MIRFIDVYKEYDNGTKALKGIDLRIDDGEFVFLVGPSGSGKSTIIKLITGEIALTQGKLMVNGYSLNNISPRQVPLMRRTLGIIFQDFRLIDKKTVYENLAFAMRAIGASSRDLKRRIPYVLQLVGLDQKADRYPGQLSGGEQQRVAIARALVKMPKILLLDEPLSNLDAKLRVSMRSEISKLHRQLGSTTIYVTHDQVEAMTMADRIVIMKDGVIQQVGKPMDLYEHPANKFVAGFIGSPQMNFYEVKVAGNTMTFSDGSKMQLPESVVTSLNGRQGTLVLGIRGEDIKLDPQNLDLYKDNIMSATVDSVEVMGNENNLYFNFGGTASVARVSKYEISKPGDTIDFAFVPSRMHFFDTQTEESLF
mgnify:CR=1 FL=1